jgi:hypothetical protein
VKRPPSGGRFAFWAAHWLVWALGSSLGGRVLANGWMRGRGTESGRDRVALGYLLQFKNGKAIGFAPESHSPSSYCKTLGAASLGSA